MKQIDLTRFEKLYDQFDGGHRIDHINRVRNLAVKLAEKYAPDKVELAYVAATLHDVGLIGGREGHENLGAEMVLKDDKLAEQFSQEELLEIADAIRNHRASTGNPQTILAKIISDSDRMSDSTGDFMRRVVAYREDNMPELTEEERIWEGAEFLKRKYTDGGTGTRLYFPESEKAVKEIFQSVIDAVDNRDLEKLKEILKS